MGVVSLETSEGAKRGEKGANETTNPQKAREMLERVREINRKDEERMKALGLMEKDPFAGSFAGSFSFSER